MRLSFLAPVSFEPRFATAGTHGARLCPRACAQEPSSKVAWFNHAKSGDIYSLTRLIRTGEIYDPLIVDSSSNRTALHFAAEYADAATVRALFEMARGVGGVRQDFCHRIDRASALIGMEDANGKTALIYASERLDKEGEEVVKVLKALGA